MLAAVAARRCRWPSRCRASRDVTLRGRGVISARPVCTAFRANATITHGCGQTCKKTKKQKKRESDTANVCVNAIYRSDATSLSTTLTFVFRVQFKVVTKCSGSTPSLANLPIAASHLRPLQCWSSEVPHINSIYVCGLFLRY